MTHRVLTKPLYPLILFVISISFFLIGIGNGLDRLDEGICVYGAQCVLNGGAPYRDFWTMYGPAEFYVLSLLFKILGPSIMVERVFSVTLNSLTAIGVYFLARRLVRPSLATVCWLLIVTWFARQPYYAKPLVPALLFSIVSCLYIDNFFSGKSRMRLLLAGLFTGLTTLFRHDNGAYLFMSELAAVFVFECLSQRQRSLPIRLLGTGYSWLYLFLGTAILVLPAALLLISATGINEPLSQLLVVPARVFPKFRSLPYPPPFPNLLLLTNGEISAGRFLRKTLEYFPFYLPFIVLAMVVLGLVRTARHKRKFTSKHWLVVLLILLGLTFFNQARVRSDTYHLLPVLIPSVILFAVVLSAHSESVKNKTHSVERLIVIITSIMLTFSFGRDLLRSTGRKSSIFSKTSEFVTLNIERAKGIRLKPEEAEALARAVQYIRRATEPGGRIYVGTYRHDQIAVNDAMFYFLTDRLSVTKFAELLPGVATTSNVQEQIIADIEHYLPEYIVLWDVPENVPETAENGISQGAKVLDDFIRTNYIKADTYGPHIMLRRKHTSEPHPTACLRFSWLLKVSSALYKQSIQG